MDRRAEIKSIIKVNNELVEKLIDDLLFMESMDCRKPYNSTIRTSRVCRGNPNSRTVK